MVSFSNFSITCILVVPVSVILNVFDSHNSEIFYSNPNWSKSEEICMIIKKLEVMMTSLLGALIKMRKHILPLGKKMLKMTLFSINYKLVNSFFLNGCVCRFRMLPILLYKSLELMHFQLLLVGYLLERNIF